MMTTGESGRDKKMTDLKPHHVGAAPRIEKDVKVLCTTVLDTRTAFALRDDTGEQVFIPSAVAHAAQLEPDETVWATVVPNIHYPEKTPWFAIRVDRRATSLDTAAQDNLDQKIAEYLDAQPAYATTAEVAEEFDISDAAASEALNRLFRMGSIVRADVYSKPDQHRVLFCLWAASASRFVELEP